MTSPPSQSDVDPPGPCACGRPGPRPAYWREVIVTAPAVYALILLVGTIGEAALSRLPGHAATALTVAVVVMLLTRPVMPILTRLFGTFLYPPRQ